MTTKQLLDEIIYPALYEKVTTAFPEFDFRYFGKGYKSSTGVKIDQTIGNKGKVYIYDNNISTFIDFTKGAISIWNYLQKRDALTNKETLLLLASLAEVALPTHSFSDQDYELLAIAQRQTQILEDANDFFIACLSAKDSQFAHQQEAALVRNYIEKERQYLISDLRLPGSTETDLFPQMELGLIPNASNTYTWLMENKGYIDAELYEILKLPIGAGSTHKLSIPFRDISGRILGFVFRDIHHTKLTKTPKYLYSTGLKRDDTLFNLSSVKGKKDLVIVEGILDSLICSTRGVENVVALGGTSINAKQISKAVACGAKSITLCLDNDKSGKEATAQAIRIIKETHSIACYVAILPANYKDPDEFIIAEGADRFKLIINEAVPYFLYLLNAVFDQYATNAPTWKEIDQFLLEATQIASSIYNPLDIDIFEQYFLEKTAHLGISKNALQATIEEIRFDKEKENAKKSFSNLLAETQSKLSKEPTEAVLQGFEEKLVKLKYNSSNLNFSKLLDITSEEAIRAKLSTQPESLRSGYLFREANGYSGYDELNIPAGALSIIAARTSHGKTAMLMNLALNIALSYPEKTVHFFSLEEDKEAIILKLLNIFINKDLKAGAKNMKYIRNFFKTNGSTYHNQDFLQQKDVFFNELINTGRIMVHYASSDTDELITSIKYINEKNTPGAIFIDYIQLLNLRQSFQSRQLELQSICNKLLKDLAVPTGLPLVLGAQFNREVFEEGMMDATKIREAGDIEQTSNLVLGLWNRGYTNSNKHKDKKGNAALNNPNELYLEVLKNRDGQSGLIAELEFNGSTGKISNKYDNSNL